MKKPKDGAKEALRKKALGYEAVEVVEEWGMSDGEMQLVKRKVTKKEVPPDLSALKAYIESQENQDEYEAMSVEQLIAEREKLLEQLKYEKE